MAETLKKLPKNVLTKEGEKPLDLKDYPLIGLYFSAHWCPPCRGFTPVLAEFYKKVNEAKKEIQIIFFSSDQDEASYKEYYGTMPWIAAKLGDESCDSLSEQFNVQGIPTFIVLDKDGNVVDKEARKTVVINKDKPEEALKVWNKKK